MSSFKVVKIILFYTVVQLVLVLCLIIIFLCNFYFFATTFQWDKLYCLSLHYVYLTVFKENEFTVAKNTVQRLKCGCFVLFCFFSLFVYLRGMVQIKMLHTNKQCNSCTVYTYFQTSCSNRIRIKTTGQDLRPTGQL